MKKPIGLGKSDSKFHNYCNWLEEFNLSYIILDWEKNNFEDIYKCSSLLLTGGKDIYPEFYNDWDDGKNKENYLPERDGFEFKLLDYAFANKLPVFGICRGMQLINCRLNGSLISDIETIRGTNHRKISNTEDRMHNVNVAEGTLLRSIIKENSGIVNSSHHQAVDRLGEGLRISAKSDDGIIEGFEWDDKSGKSFLIGVQWHPERMNDKESPFSKNLMLKFIEEIEKNNS